MYLGIDPGNTESGYAYIREDYSLVEAGKIQNKEILSHIKRVVGTTIIVESLQSFGMPVGREIFETAYFIGRIMQICSDRGLRYYLYPRPEYAKCICGVQRVTDSVLRQALLLRFGGDKKDEPLYLLKGASDKRSAFAVAAYHIDKIKYDEGMR